MAFSLVNLFTNISTPSTSLIGTASSNNPFTEANIIKNRKDFYAKNKPVAGGYFAGYYNGKPNIVGRKLFIEV